MDKKFTFYHMHKNAYLDDCLCIVYRPTIEEITSDALQSHYILIFVKSKLDLFNIHKVEDFQSNDIFSLDSPILLRISSECLLGTFGDAHCDCESQRISSLREININGQGIYIYIPQEGQGNGLYYKTQELELQISGNNPSGEFVGEKNVQEAAEYLLGSDAILDKRNYKSLNYIFRELLLNRYSYVLISDDPVKNNYLQKTIGLSITSLRNVRQIITVENVGEYLAKLYMKDFELPETELQDIYYTLFSAKEIPSRTVSLLKYIKEDLNYGKSFRANRELLDKIITLGEERFAKNPHSVQDLDFFKDSMSYSEYQTELCINDKELNVLFKNSVFTNDESLHYEENYFYDLVYFKNIPSRSLKIRKSFRLNDRAIPTSLKLIYKVPLSDKNYAIKSIPIHHLDIADIISLALKDYEIHFLPVFTHNLSSVYSDVTILLKRYSHNLRTLSLMGKEEKVKNLIEQMRQYIKIKEIDDPTNHRFIRRDLSLDFQYDILSTEELEIFKHYYKG